MKIVIKVMENGTVKWTHNFLWPQKKDNDYEDQTFEVDIKNYGCGIVFKEKIDTLISCMTEHTEDKETTRIIKNMFVPPNLESFMQPLENVKTCEKK